MDTLEELAILLLAEGSLRYHSGYEIQFTNTDAVLNKRFGKLVVSLGFRPMRKSEKQTVVYSRELAEKLLNLCGSIRTKRYADGTHPDARFSEYALQNPRETLRIFFSCEGGVVISGKSSEVIVRVCHPRLKVQVCEMLAGIGIAFTERGNGLISIKRKEAINRFAKEINFLNGVVSCRGNNKGVEKRVLLESLIQKSFRVNRPSSQPSEVLVRLGFRGHVELELCKVD